ncbi:MAG: GNAT family N-acetyltransferase [Eubacteriales bacterium]
MPTFITEYRTVAPDEISSDLFDGFVRTQTVMKCRRKRGEEWVIIDEPFIDDWDESDIERLCTELRSTVSQRGVMFGAFIDGKLKGFAAVEPDFFGSRSQYLNLSELHVSAEYRGNGMGKKLFGLAKSWAKRQGAEKLYMSTHSAVESQAFYLSMGCVEAEEYNSRLVEKEPCDCQLECGLENI